VIGLRHFQYTTRTNQVFTFANESEQATQQFGKNRETKSENNSVIKELAILEIYLPATVFLKNNKSK
jgi:hypothetical protein